ncbi:hypothetical protein BDA96_07G167200 [Sorghum bicolor]|uniref:Uncharacterized protein n=2 Tax=Sorghum bicolor TaxID=4558 RepID=A0A921UAT5_SORBI|nr:hypothetical protein BDA96_07G167200 [Sorghum bicolor]OQU80629.1 hypothetical protein SORBI_3007G155950 [Sorghum bicolor]
MSATSFKMFDHLSKKSTSVLKTILHYQVFLQFSCACTNCENQQKKNVTKRSYVTLVETYFTKEFSFLNVELFKVNNPLYPTSKP